MDELSRELRSAAEEHIPDKARMWARVERGMAADTLVTTTAAPRPPGRKNWLRVAGAAVGVAAVVAVAGISATAAIRDDKPGPSAVTTAPQPATPLPSPTRTEEGSQTPDPSRKPSSDAPSNEPSQHPSASDAPTTQPPSSAGTGTSDGPLWSDGSVNPHSNEFWAQSDVTVDTSKPLTSLVVEVRIALTEGVESTGAWRTLPAADFTSDVVEADGFLVYRWTLKDGRTVPAGRHVFAGQYNHAGGGRDAKDDSYAAQGVADGEPVRVDGDFARQD